MTRNYKDIITRFYEKVDPRKTKTVDALLTKYEGREEQLLAALHKKYGTPMEEHTEDGTPEAEVAKEEESAVNPKAPLEIPETQTSPAVVTAKKISTSYRDRLLLLYERYAPSRIVDIDRELAANKGKEEEFLKAAVDQYGAANMEGFLADANADDYRERLVALYKTYAPSKLHKVDLYLQKYQGREASLLKAVEAKLLEHIRAASEAATPHTNSYDVFKKRLYAVYKQHAPRRLNRVDHDLQKYPGREEDVIQAAIRKYGPPPTGDDVQSVANLVSFSNTAMDDESRATATATSAEGLANSFTKPNAEGNVSRENSPEEGSSTMDEDVADVEKDKTEEKNEPAQLLDQKIESPREKAKAENRAKAEDAVRAKAAEEAAQTLAKADAHKREEEAVRARMEEEIRARAEEEARSKTEKEAARAKAEQETREKADKEAREKTEREAREKAEEEAAIAKAAHEARLKAEAEARAKAKEEEAARAKVEQEAREIAEKEAREKAEEETARVNAENAAAREKAAVADAKAKEKAEAAARAIMEEEACARAEAMAHSEAAAEEPASGTKAEAEAARMQEDAELPNKTEENLGAKGETEPHAEAIKDTYAKPKQEKKRAETEKATHTKTAERTQAAAEKKKTPRRAATDVTSLATTDEVAKDVKPTEEERRLGEVNRIKFQFQTVLHDFFRVLGTTLADGTECVEHAVCLVLWDAAALDPAYMCAGDMVTAKQFTAAVQSFVSDNIALIERAEEKMSNFIKQCREKVVSATKASHLVSHELRFGFWTYRCVQPSVVPSWKRCWATLSDDFVLTLCVPHSTRSQMDLPFERIASCQMEAAVNVLGVPKHYARNGLTVKVTEGPDPLQVLLCPEQTSHAQALVRAYRKWKRLADNLAPSPSPARGKSVSCGLLDDNTQVAVADLAFYKVWCCRSGSSQFFPTNWTFARGVVLHHPYEDERVTYLWDLSTVEEVVRIHCVPIPLPHNLKEVLCFVVRCRGGKTIFCCCETLKIRNRVMTKLQQYLLRREFVTDAPFSTDYPKRIPGKDPCKASRSTTVRSMNSSMSSSTPAPARMIHPMKSEATSPAPRVPLKF